MDESKNSPANGNNGAKWLVLLTVIIGTFLGRIDQTIVNLALPKIIEDFRISVTAAGWIATAYILANAVFVPIWGKLGDTIGRKKVYLMGFGIFIFASMLAGFAWNLGSLIVFRIIQAVASSADYPTAMSIIAVTFKDGKERAQALGVWSASFAAAAVFGPLIGGPLIDNFGWRSIFLINIPIGILGMIMAIVFVKESVSGKKTFKFDWFGAITLGVALSSLVLVLDKGLDWGWLSEKAFIAYLVVVIFGIIFYFIEKHSQEPIVDFKFFKSGIFVNTLANNFLVFMAMMGSVFLIPVFSQIFLGYTSTESGYLFIPMAVALMAAAPLGGSFVGKVQPRIIIALSTFIASIGMFLFYYLLDPRSGAIDIMIPLTIMAFGLGLGMPQRTSLIAFAAPKEEIGIASSILALGRNIAGAFGIALAGTILTSSAEWNILKLASNGIINSASPLIRQQVTSLIILKAQVMAYRTVFLAAAFILVFGTATSLFIKVKKEIGVKKVEVMAE